MAGAVADVCVAFPAPPALREGCEMFDVLRDGCPHPTDPVAPSYRGIPYAVELSRRVLAGRGLSRSKPSEPAGDLRGMIPRAARPLRRPSPQVLHLTSKKAR